jgi:hypothetical protein
MSTILKILSVIVDLVSGWSGRRQQPNNQLERAKDEDSRIIATGDGDAINRELDRDTGRLP